VCAVVPCPKDIQKSLHGSQQQVSSRFGRLEKRESKLSVVKIVFLFWNLNIKYRDSSTYSVMLIDRFTVSEQITKRQRV